MGAVIEIDFHRHRDELIDSWQGRAVKATCTDCADALIRPKSRLGLVLLSVLAHNFDDALMVLLRAAFPFSIGRPGAPMLTTAGRVDKAGRVIADLIRFNGQRVPRQVLFRNTEQLRSAFRRLADELKFNDGERLALFDCINNSKTGWLACDERLDPNMDRFDPDAKRLTVS